MTTRAPLNDSLESWPALPYPEWQPTQETLHRWLQIVGKVKLALSPFVNEWWNVALTVTARGLTTGPSPTAAAPSRSASISSSTPCSSTPAMATSAPCP